MWDRRSRVVKAPDSGGPQSWNASLGSAILDSATKQRRCSLFSPPERTALGFPPPSDLDLLPFRLPTWRLVLALAGALVTVSAAQGHGLPVRKSVSGPEVVEQLVRVSTGGVGSQQDWAIVWAAASPVTLFYDEVLPPELAYVGGSLTCEVLLEGVWQRDCVGTFTAPDTIRTEDTFLDALEQVVISFSTTLASCPVEDAEGFSVSCCNSPPSCR